MQKLLLAVDRLSTWVGQTFAWLIVALTLFVSWEVFSRYALGAPHAHLSDQRARQPGRDAVQLARPRPDLLRVGGAERGGAEQREKDDGQAVFH